MINAVSRNKLINLQFDIDRIESVPEFVDTINRFPANGGKFGEDAIGVEYVPITNTDLHATLHVIID